MQQRKQHQVDGGEHRPTVLDNQQVLQRAVIRQVGHHAHAHVHHQHGGHHDLVGRDGDDVGQQDHPIQSDQPAQGVEEVGHMLRQADAADADVAEDPDHRAGRGCRAHRPYQNKDGAVNQ